MTAPKRDQIGEGALWQKKSEKNGSEFWSGEAKFKFYDGSIQMKMVIFPNNYKKGNQPDLRIFVTEAAFVKDEPKQRPSQEKTRKIPGETPKEEIPF